MHYFHGYIKVYDRDCDFEKQDSICAVNSIKRYTDPDRIRSGWTRHYYTMETDNFYYNNSDEVRIDHSIL